MSRAGPPDPPTLPTAQVASDAPREGPSAVRVAVGTPGLLDADVVLTLGVHHPTSHGALQLALTLDGNEITSADVGVGYLHRGAEKLFEVRDYRQLTVLANRHDWLSAFANELGVVLAVEAMLELEVPARATWLRTLLVELNRVLSHLSFLGSLPVGGGGDQLLGAAVGLREQIQQVMEEACGGRLHYMTARIGGLAQDVPAGWGARVGAVVEGVRDGFGRLAGRLRGDEELMSRAAGAGRVSLEQALGYGLSGPVARAAGLDLDLRRDEPYLAYGELAPVPVAVRQDGDAQARIECLLEQVGGSLDLADACLSRLPAGPIDVRLPKVVRAPEGSLYCWTENPLGLMGYLVVSRGERTPWRVHMRTPSFATAQVLGDVLPGHSLPDLPVILASLFLVIGDIDK